MEHTIEYGYEEARVCGHTNHTSDCYTDKLICSEQNAAPADANAPHEHTQECYKLICPHEIDTCGYIEAQSSGSWKHISRRLPLSWCLGQVSPGATGYGGAITLWTLARRHNCTIAELVAANSMIKEPDFIVAGWTLNIP